jgi:hypothetical protein
MQSDLSDIAYNSTKTNHRIKKLKTKITKLEDNKDKAKEETKTLKTKIRSILLILMLSRFLRTKIKLLDPLIFNSSDKKFYIIWVQKIRAKINAIFDPV